MTTPPPSPWLTREQAAQRLQVSVDTIDRRIADGTLTARRINHLVRLHVDAVDGLLDPPPGNEGNGA